jgi:hypothetical protein
MRSTLRGPFRDGARMLSRSGGSHRIDVDGSQRRTLKRTWCARIVATRARFLPEVAHLGP